LEPNEVFCLHQGFNEQIIYTLSYGAISGQITNVEFRAEAPNGFILHTDNSSRSDHGIKQFHFQASLMGDYKFCFTNNLIPYTTKQIFFQLSPSDLNQRESLREEAAAEKGVPSVMSQHEFTLNNIHFKLINVSYVQDYFKYAEIVDKAFADSLLEKVGLFSVIHLISIILTAYLQVNVVKRLFNTKTNAQNKVAITVKF
jgi:hypothetical protein